MFTVISTYSKADGGELIDYLPELRFFGGTVNKFRSEQPGFVSFNHVMSDDLKQFSGTTVWENEAACEASYTAENAQEEIMAAKNGLADFLNKHQISNSREQHSS